jgi:hypothetical protein
MPDETKSIEVPVHCLYRDCETQGYLLVYPSSRGHDGVSPTDGWVFYALGYPTQRSLGVCKAHQHVTLPAEGASPALEVVVRPERHGVYYEMREAGTVLGRVTFPTNTRALQFEPGDVSDALRDGGRRVAVTFGFTSDREGFSFPA